MDSRSGAGMTEGKGRITPTLTLPHQGGENLLLPPLWGKVGMGGLDCGFRHNDGWDAGLPSAGATLVVALSHVGAR